MKLELQQREKPFKVRETDPLEWIRVRLRERMRDQNDAGTAASGGGGSDLVRQVLKKRVGQVPEKPVFC